MAQTEPTHTLGRCDPASWPGALRLLLRAVEVPYSIAINRRNRYYNRNGPRFRPPIPVISVGNLILGGTGKTPMVVALVELLRELGRRPAVVARGYKAPSGGPSDEELLVRRVAGDVIYVADADRCNAAKIAHEAHGADAIVVDDGFQHRALGRDLDLVLIDALCPFGFDHLLPRGLLREPVRSLSRADAVVITRCDQVTGAELAGIELRVREHLSERPILRARHRVTALEPLDGGGSAEHLTEAIRGQNVAAFAGIGRPEAFERSLRDWGVELIGHHWFRDHHHYRIEDVQQVRDEFPQSDWLVTTEKDAVKLAPLDLDNRRIAVVKVAIDLDENSHTMLRSLVRSTLARKLP
jgi:tetraacyldisaccharide 4'-kinase